MALNVTTAVFRPGFNIATASPSLVQWDQGQVLKFEGVELPSAYQVEFTNAVTVQAITMIGNENGVEIPNELLQQSFPITAYIVLHETAEDRETEYWATIYVKARQQPREETPDPEQSSVIDQTIAALQDGVAEAQEAANEAAAASQAVQDMGVEAETLPEESAATVEKTVDPETGAVTLTFGIPKGTKGNKGDKGNPGETYLLAPSVDTIVKNPNTGTFIPAQIVFTVYKVVNGTSSPYRAAAIVADIFGMGMVPHYEVVNDYRLTVPINSIADTGYVACSAYGNGGIIATITIPCILDGAKGDPGEGVAAGGTTGQFLKKKSGTDYDTEWADVDPGVTAVNGKTGAVTLTASDVGAKPASYEAPVSSVNEKSGAVVLGAGDIGYDGETTYPDASVGKEITTINSALSSLESVTEIIDTASGAIASFPDGSGLPVRSLVAEINPVQDLHGQSSPYPAGGGVNKLDVSNTTHSAYNIGNIPNTLQPSTVYSFSIMGTASFNYRLYLGDSSDPVRGLVALNANYLGSGNSESFTTPSSMEEYDLLVLAGSGSGAGNVDLSALKPEVSAGSTAPTAWTPYANECHISGWTGLQGQRTGKNLFKALYDGRTNAGVTYTVDENGVISMSGTATGSSYAAPNLSADISKMQFFRAGTYTLSGGLSSSVRLYFGGKYVDGGSFSGIGYDTGNRLTYTFLKDFYAYPQIVVSSGTDTSGMVIKPMLEVGSTASTYEPYIGEAISVSFGRTVYGGTDEVIGGNGTSTHELSNLRNYTASRINTYDYNGKHGVYFQYGYSITTDRDSGLCNVTVVSTTADNPASHYMWFGVNSSHVFWIGILDALGMTLEEFKTWITQNDVIITRRLATPQSFTHSPQEVDTLVGQNNVWVDTGDVSVTYQASIKGYIDKVLGS